MCHENSGAAVCEAGGECSSALADLWEDLETQASGLLVHCYLNPLKKVGLESCVLPAQKWGATNIAQSDQSSVSGSGTMVQKDARLWQDAGTCPASHIGI